MNKRLLSLAIGSALFFGAAAAPAQPPRELVGKVYHLGENGEEIVETKVAVRLEPSGAATTTNNQGIFRLPLVAYLRADDQVTVSVGKEGWRIRYPLDGELRIPAEPLRHVQPIELLPAGSKLFWTHDRIEKFIGDALRNSGRQVAAKAEDPKVDFSRAIHEWAGRYGLSVESAQAEIEKWAAEVKEASGSDERQLGLAAFAEQQFEKAAGHFGAAAAANTAELAQIEKDEATLAAKKKEVRRAAMSNFRDQGNAHWSAQRFEESTEANRSALEYVSRQEDGQDWATLQYNLGNSLVAQGIRTSGEASTRLLSEAVASYRRALEVRTREQLPQDWARTQNNLGNALAALGHFAEAGAAHREVLEFDPENSTSFYALLSLDYDRLHDAAGALTLAKSWLERHSDDALVRQTLPEWLFATRNFVECGETSAAVAEAPTTEAWLWSVLTGYHAAALLALNQAEPSLAKLDQMIAKIAEQAADFKTTSWSFKGTLNFVQHEPELPHRDALIALFEALEAADRDAILSGLRRVRELVAAAPPS